ncbi:hypothetical protein BGW39_010519 [Mortierella sp. 14UC]|nr:hypothetical protein BGW39_010519 [Mortierella sp. 14UC]
MLDCNESEDEEYEADIKAGLGALGMGVQSPLTRIFKEQEFGCLFDKIAGLFYQLPREVAQVIKLKHGSLKERVAMAKKLVETEIGAGSLSKHLAKLSAEGRAVRGARKKPSHE